MSTAAQRLRLKLSLAQPALRQSAERLWCSPHIREVYPVYLVTVHGITRSAAPLLEAAAERARALAPDDEVAATLAPYLARHALEEKGHDKWVIEDIEALGGDPAEPLRRMPSARVANLVGAQYYWLRHHHPLCLLGHMAVVEGYPPQPGFAERLRILTGYPADAFRTIARHERIDVGHSEQLFEMIDRLALNPAQETMLGVSALHTIHAIIDALDEIHATVLARLPVPRLPVGVE